MSIWVKKPPGSSCLTAGCALGWATVCFPRAKFKIVDHELDSWPLHDIEYDGYFGVYAAAKFFELNNDQAHDIFWPLDSNVGPSDVAERIEKLVGEV
jgi:hypothetical protein